MKQLRAYSLLGTMLLILLMIIINLSFIFYNSWDFKTHHLELRQKNNSMACLNQVYYYLYNLQYPVAETTDWNEYKVIYIIQYKISPIDDDFYFDVRMPELYYDTYRARLVYNGKYYEVSAFGLIDEFDN